MATKRTLITLQTKTKPHHTIEDSSSSTLESTWLVALLAVSLMEKEENKEIGLIRSH